MIEYRVAAIARFKPAAVLPVGFSTTTTRESFDARDVAICIVASCEGPTARITSISPEKFCDKIEFTESSKYFSSLRTGRMTEISRFGEPYNVFADVDITRTRYRSSTL
jgi:hypothetical protein